MNSFSTDFKICIVGAGITGIASASYCEKHGVPYELRELSPLPGGILRDWQVGEDWFFRNCQYLSADSQWLGLIPQEQLRIFPNVPKSYTDIWGRITCFSGFGGPVYSSDQELSKLRLSKGFTLADRINMYPQEISERLFEWLHKLNLDPLNLHASNAVGLQISRIFPILHLNYIYKLKKHDANADEIYGLPREYLGVSPDLAAIPENGFSKYFDHICRELNIIYRTPVKSEFIDSLNSPNPSENHFHYVLWTGNPTPLIKHCCHSSLDTPVFKARNMVFSHPSYSFSCPFYIQVFSLRHSITRIFCYFNKITVETLDDGSCVDHLFASCREIMSHFKVVLQKPDRIELFRDLRFFLTSPSDYQKIENFIELNDINSRLISCPWHEYGRDQKINYVLSSLNSLNKHE